MKNKLILGLALLGYLSVFPQKSLPIYKDENTPIENRIEDLLIQMTLEEKILQMNQWTYGKNANPNNYESKIKDINPEIGSIIYRSTNPKYRNYIQKKAIEESRLGIPIIFGFDVIHGYRTIFPIPLAQACSWNIDLVKKSCEISAKEAWLSGIDWTFSPMVDVARDARWGRVSEGYGEDSYANSVFGVAAIQGYQGEDLSDKYTIAACLKHYIGYSLSEGGRDYHYSDVSQQTLWETFIPPFEAGINAGAATVMSGFNDISGIPASANHYTLTEILKEQWEFDGFVVSDWGSIKNLIYQGVAKDRKEAGLKSFLAGVDMDMVDDVYIENLSELIKEEKITISQIDEAVRRILRVKFKLGLFDNPYVDELDEKDTYLQPNDLKIAQKLAVESMVLLKNENDVLPLKSSYKNIAIIGPMAKDSVNIMGFWEGKGRSEDVETVYEGLTKEFGTKLKYAKGCDFDGNDTSGFKEAIKIAEKSEIVLIFLGEKRNWSGENGSRSTLSLPKIQEQLVLELKKTGKPIILILSSGRPLELNRLHEEVDAIIEMWQPGTAGGSAISGIISGRINPSGKLSITFPLTTGQIPIYYNMRPSAVPGSGNYKDIPKEPLYWMGHGLSYTTYSYSDITLSSTEISKSDTLIAEIEVSNIGNMTGKETVLWYISDPVANISRPVKELKFFEKKELKKGTKAIYRFEINPIKDLSYIDSFGNKHLESGDFYITVNDKKVRFKLVD
ncbi:beta-glucosidase [Flaviramulus basaltis]|uniref:beta-glucosidase n=1 Tax=Flaviramulus basaltis TaxID=369401 RepID=A0A1K2IRH3_9FLAO|nr:glycoside hydrolase family 3 N-terminal domain-containing protein [Flaviramulus basaltis]SFZ95037.1 beta-glucosidase [Flaviramulus basaltis]